jgi:hypothetical protein
MEGRSVTCESTPTRLACDSVRSWFVTNMTTAEAGISESAFRCSLLPRKSLSALSRRSSAQPLLLASVFKHSRQAPRALSPRAHHHQAQDALPPRARHHQAQLCYYRAAARQRQPHQPRATRSQPRLPEREPPTQQRGLPTITAVSGITPRSTPPGTLFLRTSLRPAVVQLPVRPFGPMAFEAQDRSPAL